jgi:iron complex transport system ATP-binding protein
MSDDLPFLTTQELTVGYRSKHSEKIISKGLNLKLWPGNLVCLLGSNGSGKSTLMRTLAGLQPPLEGNVFVDQQQLDKIEPGDLAKRLSLVLTERIEVGSLTAREVITLGRTPYTNWFGSLGETDHEKIQKATINADVSSLLDKRIHQLSDGERQKVMLARALAQDTDLIMLDEPTAHLDLPTRIEMMNLLHSLARTTGKAILLSTHELDLALQTADYLWLLKHDGEVATGIPEDLVLDGAFESAFSKPGLLFDRTSGTFSIRTEPGTRYVQVYGDDDLVLWTKRALKREGYEIVEKEKGDFGVKAARENGSPAWEVTGMLEANRVGSLEALIRYLRSA